MKIKNNHIILDDKSLYHSGFNTNLILKYLKGEPNTILEFGSYDGGDALRYKMIFNDCNVYSIEACPTLYSKLSFLREYDIDISNYAISDQVGVVDFYQSIKRETKEPGPTGSILKATDKVIKKNKQIIYNKTSVKVNSITISEFCRIKNIKEIDFMHSDIQGAMLHAINGFGDIKPKVIFSEVDMSDNYEGGDVFEELNDKLINMGYVLIFKRGFNSLYVLKKIY